MSNSRSPRAVRSMTIGISGIAAPYRSAARIGGPVGTSGGSWRTMLTECGRSRSAGRTGADDALHDALDRS